jgi:hypothetical protein
MDFLPLVGHTRYPKLPVTKYVYDPIMPIEDPTFAPANLDSISLYNGLKKYDHPQKSVTNQEYHMVLIWLKNLVGGSFVREMWTMDKAIEEMDLSKSPGQPYGWLYGPTKKDALKHEDKVSLVYQFLTYIQIVFATLKDELRDALKDARMFIPANICMIFIGNWLFGAQNKGLSEDHIQKIIKIGLSSPGPDGVDLWQKFREAIGRYLQADGSWNDSQFASILACWARDLRKAFLPAWTHKLVDRYYDMTYRMKLSVFGNVFEVIGQQSGHTNTASDNSIGTLALLCLNAIRNDVSLEEFKKALIAIMGDDLLLCDGNLDCFKPECLDETWRSLGMFIEVPKFDEEFSTLSFMGMTPKDLGPYNLYTYNVPKMLQSANYYKRSMTKQDRMLKLLSLTQNVFADQDAYSKMRQAFWNYIVSNGLDGQVYVKTDFHRLLKLYCGWE